MSSAMQHKHSGGDFAKAFKTNTISYGHHLSFNSSMRKILAKLLLKTASTCGEAQISRPSLRRFAPMVSKTARKHLKSNIWWIW